MDNKNLISFIKIIILKMFFFLKKFKDTLI